MTEDASHGGRRATTAPGAGSTWDKDQAFVMVSDDPLCGGAPVERLVDSFLTPTSLHFVRNHGTIPFVDRGAYRLSVSGLVRRPLALTLDALRDRFPRHETVATLQCAGNRREELIAVRPIPGEVPWDGQGIGTARWAGASLADVMTAAGIDHAADVRHVAFEGLDDVVRDGRTFGFGGSISLERALAGDVLLAFEMNGEPLTPVHGAPVRVVVPGFIGARSVKWLRNVTVQREPSGNHFEARAYKLFGPEVGPATADWDSTPPIETMQRNSFICRPAPGTVAAGDVTIEGWATAAGDATVDAVEVSLDGGRGWRPAQLVDAPMPGCWVRWRSAVHLEPGDVELVVRTRDAAGEQPGDLPARWNFKGYMNDAWHRVRATAEEPG